MKTDSSRRRFMKISSVLGGLGLTGNLSTSQAEAKNNPRSKQEKGNNGIEKTTVVKADPETQPRAGSAQVIERFDGSLLIFYHKYIGSGGTDHDEAEIYRQTSYNGGSTWEDETLVVGYGDVSSKTVNLMTPALTTLPNGDILLSVLQKLPNLLTSQLLFRSTNKGATFHHEGYIWSPTDSLYRISSPGSITQLSSGRLLFPAFEAKDPYDGSYDVGCYLSDDSGETWSRSSPWRSLPMRGAMEPSIAKSSEGDLTMSLRTQLGSVFLSHSHDDGETWSLPQTSGHRTPEAMTCLRRIPRTGDLLLIWNNHPYVPDAGHFGNRTPLAAAISSDGGETWSAPKYIETNPTTNFTGINCNFVDNGDAIVTYMVPQTHFGRNEIDLRAAIIPFSWFNRPAKKEVDFEDILHPEYSANDLVVHYALDGNDERIVEDSSGNGFDATNRGATPGVSGEINTAYRFNKSEEDVLSAPDFPELIGGSISVGIWAYLHEPDGYQDILMLSDGTTNVPLLIRQHPDGHIGAFIGDAEPAGSPASTTLESSNQIPLEEWHHVTVIYDDNTKETKLYVDGTVQVSQSKPAGIKSITRGLLAGGWPDLDGGIQYLNGKLDDIRVYNRTLSDSEIQSIYEQDTN